MERPWRPVLLAFLAAVAANLPVSSPFNLDTVSTDVYTGEPEDFFGYKVLQFTSGGSKGVIITSPLRLNGSGGISRHQPHAQTWFQPAEPPLLRSTVVKHLGLSVAADSTGSHFTVCSPSVAHECYENSYLNSVCYNVTDRLQQVSSFTPAFQNCTKKTVDLVFLFDGSNSMSVKDFNKNKEFIEDIMTNLQNTSIKFAAAQFSAEFNKVFDFNDYVAGRAVAKLRLERHMKSLTNTYKALTNVLDDIFEGRDSGASADATKVVVVITDGDPSDYDKDGIIDRYDQRKIIRFVIGVKVASLEKFKEIVSEPKDQNAFRIENYDGLTGVLENFQKKIFTMEGSTVARAGNMMDEMAQTGFSVAVHKDKLILGSVGSNSWRGSIQEWEQLEETQLEDPAVTMDSYMGYSVAAGERRNVSVYFTGAPRFQHAGRVVLFRGDGGKWNLAQSISGEQIGSYFGAELCSLDVDSDGQTDFLLVGAPLFYQPQERKEGRIYVYSLSEELQLKAELNVTAPSIGRFGATISSLADLNGDGLRDVAVGAPLEDDNHGAVYIYLGKRQGAIRSTYSQRITGESVNPRPRFFGQSVSGDIDLGTDGLPDIVVGSEGAAVILRSRPVFNVSARLSFHPEQISTDSLDCLSADASVHMVGVTVCFDMVEVTKSTDGGLSDGLNVTYTLEVDHKRTKNRGFFQPTDTKSQSVTRTYELTDERACFNHSVYMTKCVLDTLSPVTIRLKMSQSDSESARAVLNVDSQRNSTVEVPFERHCRNNVTCVAELDVDFSFLSETLLVTEDASFNVSVRLDNRGDDSYNTSLTMRYPEGLCCPMMSLFKATRSTLHSCRELNSVPPQTACGVSRPVYRSQSWATFNTSFRVSSGAEWNDTVSLSFEAKSDNTNFTVTRTKSIAVQFEIQMVITVKEDSVTYMNFTSEEAAPRRMFIKYQVNNIGFRDFPATVSLVFPTKLEHDFEMSNYKVWTQQNGTHCSSDGELKSDHCAARHACAAVTCRGLSLGKNAAAEFTLEGDVHFRELTQLAANLAFLKRYTGDGGEVKFRSFLRVDYDTRRYKLRPFKQESEERANKDSWKENTAAVKWTEVRVEFIIPRDQLLIILTGAFLGFLLLLIITLIMFKLGCFRRKTMDDYYKQEEEEALQDDSASKPGPGPAPGPAPADSDEQKPEEKSLLDAEGPDVVRTLV